ncbi:MAG: 30S ribosomal protein S8e, partial [Candidatus Aenigmatarchaeota archaeon]
VIGPLKKRIDRRRAGIRKERIVSVDFVNILNPKTKKTKKAKLLSIIEHEDNINFTRRGIITKGCIVKTDLGIVKITSRPSQHGVINGILVEK